jgi:hypothetical protein
MILMKKTARIINAAAFGLVLMLSGCSGDEETESAKTPEEVHSPSVSDSKAEYEKTAEESSADASAEETPSESDSKVEDRLAGYDSKAIEYARVWMQLGSNQEIDELNVRHIPAGEKINPNEETSASYPEEVIQLAGSRLVDGSVTYSGNGDGTIFVYNVPLRWDGAAEVDENYWAEYTKEIIENRKQVYVDPGDDERIKQLIELLNVQS